MITLLSPLIFIFFFRLLSFLFLLVFISFRHDDLRMALSPTLFYFFSLPVFNYVPLSFYFPFFLLQGSGPSLIDSSCEKILFPFVLLFHLPESFNYMNSFYLILTNIFTAPILRRSTILFYFSLCVFSPPIFHFSSFLTALLFLLSIYLFYYFYGSSSSLFHYLISFTCISFFFFFYLISLRFSLICSFPFHPLFYFIASFKFLIPG